jgi:dolichol-phosphate mannosyltransferase
VIDIDLQDPPEIIPQMYEKLKEGYEVISARRRSRKGETIIKRFISRIGYQVISRISDIDIPSDVGDFRIMTRKVIEELRRLQETHGFLRGLVSFVGFRQTTIDYDRNERYSGHGKYNQFFGSFKIGLNGIICFSSKPLQLMSIIGIVFAGFSFLLGGWYVLQKLIGLSLTPALPTIVLVVTFFAGIQLLALGVIGEYIGRIYDEVKKRPSYIIDKTINM